MEAQVVGFILLVVGGLTVVRPDVLVGLQAWQQRVIMGAKYEPSERTYRITRFIGALFVLIGLLAITGVIR